MDKFNRNFPNYDDDSDYNTNANSYYKDLGRKTKLIKLLAKRIWEYDNTLNETLEQIEQRLTDYILENDTLMTERLENWDKRIDEMPEEMRTLFVQWLNDGTLEQIINDDVLGNKADKTYVNELNENITTQVGQIDVKTKGIANIKEYGVVGDGVTDDTEALQTALDNAEGLLFFPQGQYKVSDTLYLKRNISLLGANTQHTRIVAEGLPTTKDLFVIAIEKNYGWGDLRNWYIKNIAFSSWDGGRYSIRIAQAPIPHLTNLIENISCGAFYVDDDDGGNGNEMVNSLTIRNSTLSRLIYNSVDGLKVENNLFTGSGWAIILDLKNGVRNTTIERNILVTSGGAVKIINGDNVRIKNNQIEQVGTNTMEKITIKLEGQKRQIINTVIEENNFGGGTNINQSLYIDNAYKTVVAKNNFVACRIADVHMTPKAVSTYISSDNHTISTVSNARIKSIHDLKIVDEGKGVIGYPKEVETLNSWSTKGKIVQSKERIVHFEDQVSNGLKERYTNVLKLPKGFRRKFGDKIYAFDSGKLTEMIQTFNGYVYTNEDITGDDINISPFISENDYQSNKDFIVYDEFTKTLPNTSSEHVWDKINGNLTTENSSLRIDTSVTDRPEKHTLLYNMGISNVTVYATVGTVGKDYSKANRIVFWYKDENNYFYLTPNDVDGFNYSVYEVKNGLEKRNQGRSGFENVYYNDGDNVSITLNGSTYEVIVNNVSIMKKDVTTDISSRYLYGLEIYKSGSATFERIGFY